MVRRAVQGQLDLLAWENPEPAAAPIVRFSSDECRGATFAAQLSTIVSATLQSSDRSREEIASAMSAHLGRPLSVNILNAYASPQRETHQISVPRFAALLQATKDRRLLQFLADPCGWVTIDSGYVPLIEMAAIQAQQNKLRKQAASLRRHASRSGVY